jgi:peroxiredoxin
MDMRAFLAVSLASVLLCLPAAAVDAPKIAPRPSPEFVINYPNGKQALLSSYKGKVVVLAFIFTTCPHCQKECQMLSKLNTELGPKGFQPLAVAVNPMAVMLINDFVRDYHINFPVGASEKEPTLDYMKIKADDRWVVPQIAVIDRKGVIRYQSPFNGDEKLQNEDSLKAIVESLLKEPATVASAKKKHT